MSNGLKFDTAMQFAYGVPDPLATGVARLVANNASALTFNGTNTYLVGTQALAVIDPGPADAAHLAAILKAAGGRPIRHILITHAHRDHVDGLAALAAETGAKSYGFRREQARSSGDAGESVSEYINTAYTPDVSLTHGDRIEGDGWELSALHTPGHTADHLCFALEGSGLVFSGDHVMAWNTSVVAPPEGRMADYLRSLELLLERRDSTLLPGHGGPVAEPRRTAKPTCCIGAGATRPSSRPCARAPTPSASSCQSSTAISTRKSPARLDYRCARTSSISPSAGSSPARTPRTSIALLFLFDVVFRFCRALGVFGRNDQLHAHNEVL